MEHPSWCTKLVCYSDLFEVEMIQTIGASLLVLWAFSYFFVKLVYPFFREQKPTGCSMCAINLINMSKAGSAINSKRKIPRKL